MTYEQEIQFSDSRWIQRLTNKNAVQFIATYANKTNGEIDPQEETDAQEADAREEAWRRTPWLGSLVLVRKADDAGTGEENAFDGGLHVDLRKQNQWPTEVVFHMNAVFLDPSVRRQGLGKRMVQAARGLVAEEARQKGVGWARMTTLVDSWNTAAIGLYASQKFERKRVDEYEVDGERREAVEMECLLDIGLLGSGKSSSSTPCSVVALQAPVL